MELTFISDGKSPDTCSIWRDKFNIEVRDITDEELALLKTIVEQREAITIYSQQTHLVKIPINDKALIDVSVTKQNAPRMTDKEILAEARKIVAGIVNFSDNRVNIVPLILVEKPKLVPRKVTVKQEEDTLNGN